MIVVRLFYNTSFVLWQYIMALQVTVVSVCLFPIPLISSFVFLSCFKSDHSVWRISILTASVMFTVLRVDSINATRNCLSLGNGLCTPYHFILREPVVISVRQIRHLARKPSRILHHLLVVIFVNLFLSVLLMNCSTCLSSLR